MRLFSRRCDFWQLPYAAATEGIPLRERLELEAHAAACSDCADALRNARAVDVAVRGAFDPLRQRRVMLAPGRVRLAVGAVAPQGQRPLERQTWLRIPTFFGRLAEVSVMLGVTLFVVGGSFAEPHAVPQQPQSVIQEYFRSRPSDDDVIEYFRWLQLRSTPPAAAREAVRLPAGGLYDVEPAEIVTSRTATPH